MFDSIVEVVGPKCCSRTEGYSKEVSKRGAEACATMFSHLFHSIDFADGQTKWQADIYTRFINVIIII